MEKARIPQLKAIEKLEKECLNAERDLASAKGYLNFIDQDSVSFFFVQVLMYCLLIDPDHSRSQCGPLDLTTMQAKGLQRTLG